MITIAFNKTGYDPFIDFLKAYCILVVIFCHGFPYLDNIGYSIWGVQIPLFFLIQVFHCYKREPRAINRKMIWRRIVLPFIAIELLIFGVLYLTGGQELSSLVRRGIIGGGYGTGSYYPWIYLQMVVLIPLMRPICDRMGKQKSLIVFLFLSVVMEVVCSITNLPDYAYRLLCIRYVFLIWVARIWVKEGIKFNALTISASLLSLVAIIYFAYLGKDLEPLFFNTGWATHRWICYFWVGFAFVGFLRWIYNMVLKYERVNRTVKMLASASYEIFLVQMAYYAIFPLMTFNVVENEYLQFTIYFALAFAISIAGGESYI